MSTNTNTNTINKPKNAAELTKFLNATLPHFNVTGKAKDLRKIESDPKGKGKSVIIWYGCSSMHSVTKLRVTTSLSVFPFSFGDEEIANKLMHDLKSIWSVSTQEAEKVSESAALVDEVSYVAN